MKSAYELAMERLNKTAPTVKLSEDQKKQLAELDSKYAAKIAEREIFFKKTKQPKPWPKVISKRSSSWRSSS